MQLGIAEQQPACLPKAAARFIKIARKWKSARKWNSSPFVRYALPFLAIGLALITQLAIARMLPKGSDFPYVFLYLVAVFAVAWCGGYMPGVLTCLLVMAGLPAAVVPGFRLSTVDPSRLTLLLALSLGISAVADAQRRRS